MQNRTYMNPLHRLLMKNNTSILPEFTPETNAQKGKLNYIHKVISNTHFQDKN